MNRTVTSKIKKEYKLKESEETTSLLNVKCRQLGSVVKHFCFCSVISGFPFSSKKFYRL